MGADEQEARSLKFDRRGSVTLRRLASGRWAMYEIGGVGSPFWIGDTADLVSAYDARPEPQVHTYVRPLVNRPGIDLSKLEIKL